MTLESFLKYLDAVDAGTVPLGNVSVAWKEGEGEEEEKEDRGGVGDDGMLSKTPLLSASDKKNFRKRWEEETIPAIEKIIIAALKCGREDMKERVNAFEIYGYDFMVDDSLHPWLIEINSAPCFQHSTPITSELVPIAVEDTLKGLETLLLLSRLCCYILYHVLLSFHSSCSR